MSTLGAPTGIVTIVFACVVGAAQLGYSRWGNQCGNIPGRKSVWGYSRWEFSVGIFQVKAIA